MRLASPGAARRTALVALAVALGACDPGTRPRRGPRDVVLADFDAGVLEPDGGFRPPPERDRAVLQGAPVPLGTTQCPSLRLVRVDRRRGDGGPPLPPRYFGRDEHGRYVPVHDVLACELRSMQFATSPRVVAEGVNLILQRGPSVFAPDSDCDWREPVRVEATPRGRRVALRERCRRRAVPAPAERTVVVEVPSDYRVLSAQ